ncbi:MAG: hypothetical protein ACKO3R_07455 [bacterium]
MSPVSADTLSKNLNSQLNGQFSGQPSGQPKTAAQDLSKGVVIPDSAGGAAQFSAVEDVKTAGSPDLKAQKAKLEAGFHVQDRNLNLGVMPKPLSPEEIQKRAKNLLKLTKEQVAALVPSEALLGATGVDKNRLLNIHHRLWTNVLTALAEGKKIDWKTDGDGTTCYKNPTMVASTSSQASLQDKHRRRLLAQALYFIRSQLGVLTARPGITAGLSMVAAEGKPGLSSSEEISAVIGQNAEIPYSQTNPKDKIIANNIAIYGLSGGITSEPGKPVKISEDTQRFMELMKFLNKSSLPGLEKGFLSKFLEIRDNNGEPIRTAEIKSVPAAFSLMSELTLNQYIGYMDLATKSRKEKWATEKFIKELDKLNLPLTPKLQAMLDPRDPLSEHKLTELLRDGTPACFTPHAIDWKNVERIDVQRKLYTLLLNATRHPEVQKWANEKYGIPIGEDLFSINNKSISHVKDFSETSFPNQAKFTEFIDDLKNRPNAKKENTLINVIDNRQFYIEIAPANSKGDVVPNYSDSRKNNLHPVYGGDSPGSDASAQGQAVISGGLAVIVRGLMGPAHIADKMVELLAQSKNAGHPDQLIDLGANKYAKASNPSEIKEKSQWAAEFQKKYASQIVQIDNIHLNNAFAAHIFSELVKDKPGCQFKLDPSADWIKDLREQALTRTLQTPDIGMQELGINKSLSNKPITLLADKIKGIPVLGALVGLASMYNSRPIFATGMKAVGVALMGSGTVAAAAKLSGHEELFKKMDKLQANIFGINNLVSGVARGLRSPMLYPLQTLGELVCFAASRFPSTSFNRKVLFALANGMLQIGRGNAAIQGENTILDTFKKGTEAEVKKVFGEEDFKNYGNLRPVAAELTNKRADTVKKLKPFMGEFFATAVADLKQGLEMAGQFVQVKGFRHGFLTSLVKNSGVTKTSQTSGMDYTNVASVGHAYAASGMIATGLSAVSIALHDLKKDNKVIETVLNTAETLASTFGMVTAARHVEQKAQGYPEMFTDVAGRQVNINPKQAGMWQKIGSQMMAAASLLQATPLGQLLVSSSLGPYLFGVGMQADADLEMGAINARRQAQKYTNDDWDMKQKPREVIHSVRANRLNPVDKLSLPAKTPEFKTTNTPQGKEKELVAAGK